MSKKVFQIFNRRYLGSKTKLLGFIHKTLEDENVVFDSFLDIFAGTGSVAYSFNDGKHKIIVNDILECNRCAHNSFFGSGKISHKKIERYISFFNKETFSEENYFSVNFSDTFFSKENCIKIGSIREKLDCEYNEGKINKREKDVLLTSLLYSMDQIANTVGHYDAYRRGGDLTRKLVLSPLDLPETQTNAQNQIFNEDANELAKKVFADVVYIDPPYNSRQYSDAYHLLENVATWKKPKVYGVAKKMDRSNIKSKYCENSAPRVFDDLIETLKCKYIIVSYNNMGLKGAGRSQAKISDIDIVRSLEKKGKVTIHETDFNQFSAGKTEISNHKERLFICKVGFFEKKCAIEINGIAKSPLNYSGGKFKLFPYINEKFPLGDFTFVDLFGGGFNVGVNVSYQNVIYNDISNETMRLMRVFHKYDSVEIIKKLDNLIQKFHLSDSDTHGYEFYGSNSNNGLGAYNKKSFEKVRNEYNVTKKSLEKDFLFLLLTIFSFNNQIRFNSAGFYNMPVGKRDLNASMRRNIKNFSEKLKTKSCTFFSKDFLQIDFKKIENPFFYCDPPYLLGTASYNENGGWNEEKEKSLLDYLKKLADQKIKFALSNVLEHKGKTNTILLNWTLENQFNIIYLNKDYSNSNYHIKDKTQNTVEVLITNF